MSVATKLDPNSSSLPKRVDLPPQSPDAPPGAAWVWGKDDELGRLNLLTPQRTAAASKLIQTGQVVNLNLRLDLPSPPVFGREPFTHTIKELNGGQGYDDLYHMNTQSGSQWDGYRHVGTWHNDRWVYYNGLTRDEINNTTKMGLEPWAKHGIVGRGVLLDMWHHLKKSYDPFTTRRITIEELLDCAKAQNVEFQPGDVLIIRSGWLDTYNQMNQEKRDALGKVVNYAHEFVGVDGTEALVDFLHDNYFSAVAGDQPGFEAWPPKKECVLHSILLPLWGMPIGEMWDLEELAEVCREKGQYAFFFASTPNNVAGGVGSISNAMAIF